MKTETKQLKILAKKINAELVLVENKYYVIRTHEQLLEMIERNIKFKIIK